MYEYTITLKVILIQAGIKFIIYPVIERTTNTADWSIVERAVENRYARDNRGVVSVKAVKTSVRRVRSVALC